MTAPFSLADAESLASVAEKANAHTDEDEDGDAGVTSVSYSPDGTKIVSSGMGGTIKVCIAGAESLTMIVEKQNAHSRDITSVGYNHDGTKVVSACYGGTIKVWDSGALQAPNCLSVA